MFCAWRNTLKSTDHEQKGRSPCESDFSDEVRYLMGFSKDQPFYKD
jgi:hypothetical protein